MLFLPIKAMYDEKRIGKWVEEVEPEVPSDFADLSVSYYFYYTVITILSLRLRHHFYRPINKTWTYNHQIATTCHW